MRAALERIKQETATPNSSNFMPLKKEQEFNGIMFDDGMAKIDAEIEAAKTFLKTVESGGDAKAAQEQYEKDMKPAHEPVFHEGESGGFKAGKGFVL